MLTILGLALLVNAGLILAASGRREARPEPVRVRSDRR
jgi:hypothetical protein